MPEQTAPLPHAHPLPATIRRHGDPRTRGGTVTRLLLVIALAGASAGGHAAAAPRASPTGATVTPPLQAPTAETADPLFPAATTGSWWMAFDDATLNLLVHAAQQRQVALAPLQNGPADLPAAQQVDDARRQAVASYLGVRVLSARWLALNGVAQAALRQQQLLGASTPADERAASERAALMTTLSQRRERVGLQQQALAADRAELLASLASLCGLPPAELGDLLAPLLAQPQVPSFASAAPSRLPRSILRARADVAAAEAAVLRHLRSGGRHPHEVVARMQQPEGWIDAQADLPARAVAARSHPPLPAEPELEQFNQLLDQAAQEVTQDLRTLAERARLQAERAQLAEASRAAFQAVRDRLKTGEVSELQVLEQYQHLLGESDRYAAACGELAMAWLRLVASTGASEQVLVRR